MAFHSRAEVEAHIKASTKLRGDELEAILELPGVLEQMRVSHLPAFKRVQAVNVPLAAAPSH